LKFLHSARRAHRIEEVLGYHLQAGAEDTEAGGEV